MKRFGPLALLLLLFLALTPIGCGVDTSDEEGTRAAPEDTTQAPRSSPSPRDSGGSNARTPDRAKNHGHALKIEKPAGEQKGGEEAQAAQEAIKRVEEMQKRAAQPLTPKELEDMVKRQIARTKRLLNPPRGKTVADVIREIEKEIAASVP